MSSRLLVVLVKQWDTALQQEGSVLGKLDVFLFSPPSCFAPVARLSHFAAACSFSRLCTSNALRVRKIRSRSAGLKRSE